METETERAKEKERGGEEIERKRGKVAYIEERQGEKEKDLERYYRERKIVRERERPRKEIECEIDG